MFRQLAITLTFCFSLSAGYYNGPKAGLPPLGWNTWCTDDVCGLIDKCTDKLVRSIADFMVEQGMDKLGYRFVNMDDCWSAPERDAQGRLQADPKRFPHGMKDLADYVHSKGLYIGLYTCVGTKTCKHGLPGSAGHFKIDAETVAEWGIDLVKADYCNSDKSVPARQLYANFSAALNETGREIVFSTCEWGEDNVQEWAGDVAQMYRIQADKLPFWKWPKTAAGKGFGDGAADIIEYVATVHPSKYVRQSAWLDPDFLMPFFPITMKAVESYTEYSFWALWSSPLLVATDIRKMRTNREMYNVLMNEEVIAVNQDVLFTSGERVANNSDGGQVWYKPLANGDGAVILYNSNLGLNDKEKVLNITVTWSELPGFLNHKRRRDLTLNSFSVSARDLWRKKDLGAFPTSFTASIEPRACLMLRIAKITGKSANRFEVV